MTILVPLFRFLSKGTENVSHLHLPWSLTPLLHIVDAHYWENEGPNIYQVSIQWQTLCWRHLHTLPLFWATLLWEYLSQFRNVPEIKLGTGGNSLAVQWLGLGTFTDGGGFNSWSRNKRFLQGEEGGQRWGREGRTGIQYKGSQTSRLVSCSSLTSGQLHHPIIFITLLFSSPSFA